MTKPKISDYLTSPELQSFCGQISKEELMNYTEALELYVIHLEQK